jgi:hypothetical protein
LSTQSLSESQIASFNQDGFLIIRDTVERDLVERLLEIAHADPKLEDDSKFNQNYDEEGIDTRLVYRRGFSEDAYSAVGKSESIVGPIRDLW